MSIDGQSVVLGEQIAVGFKFKDAAIDMPLDKTVIPNANRPHDSVDSPRRDGATHNLISQHRYTDKDVVALSLHRHDFHSELELRAQPTRYAVT